MDVLDDTRKVIAASLAQGALTDDSYWVMLVRGATLEYYFGGQVVASRRVGQFSVEVLAIGCAERAELCKTLRTTEGVIFVTPKEWVSGTGVTPS